jgi:hypothetical protein
MHQAVIGCLCDTYGVRLYGLTMATLLRCINARCTLKPRCAEYPALVSLGSPFSIFRRNKRRSNRSVGPVRKRFYLPRTIEPLLH